MRLVRHARFDVASLSVEGVDLPLKAAYLLVAESDDSATPQWECLAYGVGDAPIARGTYHLVVCTPEDRRLDGDAVLVRSVEGAHVFRGAGPLAGVGPTELR
ncbi:MAG: hypothetical protein JWN46_1615 [Acidimicrobiales bacterium]|nr:hypothetical protein [Acidimicrobiales bacterium]